MRCWVRRNFVNFVKHCLIFQIFCPFLYMRHVQSKICQVIVFFTPRRWANVVQLFVRVNRDSSLQYRSRAWLIYRSFVANVLISCGHFFSPSLFLACLPERSLLFRCESVSHFSVKRRVSGGAAAPPTPQPPTFHAWNQGCSLPS